MEKNMELKTMEIQIAEKEMETKKLHMEVQILKQKMELMQMKNGEQPKENQTQLLEELE